MSPVAVVIGHGANELVAAHYLSRSGYRVTVVCERVQGTALETGWVPPRIVGDLGLDRHGLSIQRPDPWASGVLPDGAPLELYQDLSRSTEAIRRVSPRDASKWPEFCERMNRLARLLESLYLAPPPDPLATGWGDLTRLARLALRVRGLGRQGMEDLLRLMPMSVADLTDDWFESDALKGILGVAAVAHLFQGPRSGGTAFNLLHHHVGSPPGVFTPPLSNLGAVLRTLPGIETRTARITGIAIRDGGATGVMLENGEALTASVIVSGLTPHKTLLELIDPGWLDPELVRAVRRIRSRGGFATPAAGSGPGLSPLIGAPSLDHLERAYDETKHAAVSRGYPQGAAYQADLALDQVLWMRPVPQLAQYRTPVHGLYLCGPAMHPGGGIAGAAGANAASVILRDARGRKGQ